MSRFGKRGPRGTKGEQWAHNPAPRKERPAAKRPRKPAPETAKPAAPERPQKAAPALPASRPAAPAPERPQRAAPAAPAAAPEGRKGKGGSGGHTFTAPMPDWITAPVPLPDRPKARVILPGSKFALKGDAYDDFLRGVMRAKGFPRAFYASSVIRGHADLDGKDEVAAMLGVHAASIRHRVVVCWEKQGGVVIEYEGRKRLAMVIEPTQASPSPKTRKSREGKK